MAVTARVPGIVGLSVARLGVLGNRPEVEGLFIAAAGDLEVVDGLEAGVLWAARLPLAVIPLTGDQPLPNVAPRKPVVLLNRGEECSCGAVGDCPAASITPR